MNPETPLWRQTHPSFLVGNQPGSQSVAECAGECLPVMALGIPAPERVSVSFAGKTTGQRKAISKQLRDFAVARGWQFGPVEEIA